MNKLPTLEQRIAAALTSTDITSSDLAALIAEVEAAAQAADEDATKSPRAGARPRRRGRRGQGGRCGGDRDAHSRSAYKPHCHVCRSGYKQVREQEDARSVDSRGRGARGPPHATTDGVRGILSPHVAERIA